MTDIETQAWPPTIPPNTRANTTPQLDSHPSDHNALATALAALVALVPAAGVLPWGRVASASLTASPPVIGTAITDVVSCSFTAVAGRRYRVSAVVTGATLAAGQTIYFIMTDGSNTQIQSAGIFVANTGQPAFAAPWVEIAPGAAGARTYKLRAAVSSGTCNLNVGATQPTQIQVEDIGV